MIIDEINNDVLFVGSSYILGKIHWYLQKADTEMRKKVFVQVDKSRRFDINPILLTDFGNDVGFDYIYWWIFKKESNIEELLKRTNDVLIASQILKEDSVLLKQKYVPVDYSDLIRELKDFVEKHKKEIDELYDFVKWIYTKDMLAPCILLTDRGWASSDLGDREVEIVSNTIDEDIEKVKECTEVALGLRIKSIYVFIKVYWDETRKIGESFDPEYQSPISVPNKEIIRQTSGIVLENLATYFKSIRDSLRNIILEISKYKSQSELLYSSIFWKSFVIKAMDITYENQLWDFKTTFQMWQTKNDVQNKYKFDFSEDIASYANANGGILIVGISDSIPRKIIGIQHLEEKLTFTKSVISKYISYNTDFVHFQPIKMLNNDGIEKDCLIIAISQTKEVISVKDVNTKMVAYPKRFETGKQRIDYDSIKSEKKDLLRDNHNYISTLYKIVNEK